MRLDDNRTANRRSARTRDFIAEPDDAVHVLFKRESGVISAERLLSTPFHER